MRKILFFILFLTLLNIYPAYSKVDNLTSVKNRESIFHLKKTKMFDDSHDIYNAVNESLKVISIEPKLESKIDNILKRNLVEIISTSDDLSKLKQIIISYQKDKELISNVEFSLLQVAKIFYDQSSKDLSKNKKVILTLNFISDINSSIDKKRELSEIYYFTGLVYQMINEHDKAIDNFKLALIKMGNSDIYSSIAISYIKTKNFSFAENYLQKAIYLDPYNSSNYYNIACVYSNENKFELAITNLRKSISIDKKSIYNARKDPDFENIKNTSEFRELVK